METPDADAAWWKREILALAAEIALESLLSERSPALVEYGLDAALRFVQRGPVCGLLRGGQFRDCFRGLAQGAFPAEVLHAGGLERGIVRRRRYLGDRAVRELFQVTRHRVLLRGRTKARHSFGTKAGLR